MLRVFFQATHGSSEKYFSGCEKGSRYGTSRKNSFFNHCKLDFADRCHFPCFFLFFFVRVNFFYTIYPSRWSFEETGKKSLNSALVGASKAPCFSNRYREIKHAIKIDDKSRVEFSCKKIEGLRKNSLSRKFHLIQIAVSVKRPVVHC